MISPRLVVLLIVIFFLILLIVRKRKGLKGTWDSKKEIQEYSLLMNSNVEPIEKNYRKYKKQNLPIKTIYKKDFESIGEKICRKHLSSRFNTPFLKERPDFLKNPVTKTNLELDCFSKRLHLALEYNGKQHYEFVPKFHNTKNDFYNQKYRDEIKKRLCFKNGIDLIEVPYTVTHEEIPLYIDSCLEKLGRLKFV